MNKSFLYILVSVLFFAPRPAGSQDIYSVSSWESLFQWADVELFSADAKPKLRYTLFLNFGQYWHLNVTRNIGFYSGLAVRNVGFIYDTPAPEKTIRRSYTLGIPLALKLGAFDKHLYIFGGGEYEFLFLYKAKRWNSNERDGAKIKETELFSDKTERFIPSWFVGIQFPGGFNLKYKQYLGDFLNMDYVGQDLEVANTSFSDFSKITVHYLSLSWQFRTDRLKKYIPSDKMAFNH